MKPEKRTIPSTSLTKMKHNVFYYMTFHIRIDDIEADTQKEAVAAGIDQAFEAGHNIGSNWGDFEFAEECTGALVDEQGDTQYENSTHFSQREIYNG
jgi:hypothetical protein